MKRAVYDRQFKRMAAKAAKAAKESRESISKAATEMGIGGSTLRRWIDEYDEYGEGAFPGHGNALFNSDQGWQYQHKQYRKMLRRKGIRQSMSRKGIYLDNAMMENFFGHLKNKLLYLQEFKSIDQFKEELIAYLEYYNNQKIKAKLKGLPPAIHRQQALLVA